MQLFDVPSLSTPWTAPLISCFILFFFLISSLHHARNANAKTATAAKPRPRASGEPRPSPAGTPAPSPLGPAVVCSTFNLDGKGRISEPEPPCCHRLKLPFDLTQRGLASSATADAHLAVKLLNLDVGEVIQSLGAWHAGRGTAASWDAARRGGDSRGAAFDLDPAVGLLGQCRYPQGEAPRWCVDPGSGVPRHGGPQEGRILKRGVRPALRGGADAFR